MTVGFWSKDGKTIYFNEGVKATDQLMALDLAANKVRQLTAEKASLRAVTVKKPMETDRIFITRADPKNPPTVYTVNAISDVETPSSWVRLTDANPWTRDLALGETEEITWKGQDGTPVGGVLVKPVGYQAGKKYPLIVSIHGGPQSGELTC